MSDEKKESAWPLIIDKLTDPMELAFSKIFSAQFLMSVITTIGACLIVGFICWKRPEHMNAVLPVFFSTWGIIVNSYFKRDRAEEKKA